MKYPEFLRQGGVIGCVAPSFGCNIEPYYSAFQNACERFRSMGYGIDLGRNCFSGDGIGISSSPQNCGLELTDYYLSEKNDILLSCGGGELMCEILDYIDFKRLEKAAPKWYVGYSDNTNFTFLLTTILETVSIYAPCAPAFGMEPWHESIKDLWDLLHGRKLQFIGYQTWEKESIKTPEQPLTPYHVTEPRILKVFQGGQQEGEKSQGQGDGKNSFTDIFIEGRVLGGCMDCLVNLLGTKYDNVNAYLESYKKDGFLWFLESCDLNVFSIRRAIWQMEHAGWFQYVNGFMFGRPGCFGEQVMGLDQYHAVTDLLGKYNVPIIMDMDFGHLPPAMPMLCGGYAKVQVKGNDMMINYCMR
ncbi:MAG: LD-carboxypeptidase [Lachnospiraceae bacterium]|nr:LD-carboxypeptidase [Lachnospiraceae bacterium]